MKKIKIILADENNAIRANTRQALEQDSFIDIVAEATCGKDVLEKINAMDPEIVVLDTDLPDMDGINLTNHLVNHYSHIAVILLSFNDDIRYIKKAMLAGAKEYLLKPASPEELNESIRQIAEQNRAKRGDVPGSTNYFDAESKPTDHLKKNKLITIFGTKGGVGKSVICTNLSVATAQKYQDRVGLVDLDIQFGDISIMMNVNPRKTLFELVQEGDNLNREIFDEFIYERYGVDILAAPNRPELAELINPEAVARVLECCRGIYQYTFIDTPSFIDETTLVALEKSDLILLVICLELPAIKNVKKGIEILKSLQLLSKTRLILNRSSGIAGLEGRDVEEVLDMKIRAQIPSDGKLVVRSINQGIPFIRMKPKASISMGILDTLALINN